VPLLLATIRPVPRIAPPITPAEADAAYAAAQKVVEVHRRVSAFLRPGHTLPAIDSFIGRTLEELDCESCLKGYRVGSKPPFHGHACLSVNDCVVHGTPDSHSTKDGREIPLKHGDVLKVDVGVHYGRSEKWVGDAAWTYVFGDMSPEVKRLTAAGKEALRRGVRELRPGNTYLAWARAVQDHVERECGFHLVRGLGGHGYSKLVGSKKDRRSNWGLHAPPFVSNVVPTMFNEWPEGDMPCRPGTLVAVEPMIALGTSELAPGRGKWPERTADGSVSVHYEHDVLITEDGNRILTEGLEETRDVIV